MGGLCMRGDRLGRAGAMELIYSFGHGTGFREYGSSAGRRGVDGSSGGGKSSCHFKGDGRVGLGTGVDGNEGNPVWFGGARRFLLTQKGRVRRRFCMCIRWMCLIGVGGGVCRGASDG